jgi:flagellar operon protein
MINGTPVNISSYQPIIIDHVEKKDLKNKNRISSDSQFESLLRETLNESKVKFSGHAKERLADRKVELDGNKVERLNDAIERAKSKGAKETLVLIDDIAMVVSVKNNTVITVMTGDTIKENVFTNIDSAVMA